MSHPAKKTKILLVEDDPNLGFVISDSLRTSGYHADLCNNGREALPMFINGTYDLCLLDVMLPKKDGYSIAEDIRKVDANIPIIFVTAKAMLEDKIKGFKAGGDDYITKPFSIEELMLRVEAVLKRNKTNASISPPKEFFEIGNYTFNSASFELKIGDDIRLLTKKEAELLRILCLHTNEVIERELVLKMVWGNDDYFLGRSMDVFITRLRKYLKKDTSIEIVNIHGVGFKFTVK